MTARRIVDELTGAGRLRTGLFIDGTFQDAEGGGSFTVDDPATGSVIADVADATAADALRALDSACAVARAWATTAPRQRSHLLMTAFELMTRRAGEFADLIVAESGKALPEATSEVAYAAEFFRWYSEEAVRAVGDLGIAPSGANRILTSYEPIGPALLITPWNFPAAMITRKVAPALAAGCPVIIKPAPETPLTALFLADLLTEAGVPAGVVSVIPTSAAPEVVSALTEDPRLRKLSFTGSTGVGQHLLRLAATNVLSCSMELGGNAPFIVFEDADLALAVDSAMIAKLRNGGQSCTAANRFLVHTSVAAEFAGRLADRMADVRVGPGSDAEVDLGPLISERARDKVTGLVAAAVADGATAIIGGTPPARDGWYFPPTVLVGVKAGSAITRAEIFGPVATISTFESYDEAITAANATEHGLVSFVHSTDLALALRAGNDLHCGMVGINRGVVSDPAAPFGGWKRSGLGREGGHEGMLEFLESKYTAVSW